MASDRSSMGIAQLLRTLRVPETVREADGQLLERFLARRDESAFASLVQKHGPMVLGVCRRLLGNEADAEDAFQATFLVLVSKAKSLSSRAVLGDWLHGAARLTALNAKRLAERRRVKEQIMRRNPSQGEEVRNDWLPLLDEELSRLAEKYRVPIVLCDLEGRTRREAAEQLGWAEGTVAGRLARGRRLLAKRLARYGATLSAGPTAMALSEIPATASPSTSLLAATVKAAMMLASGQPAAEVVSQSIARLTERVVRAMFVTRLRTLTALVLILIAVSGGAALVHRALASEPEQEKSQGLPGASNGAQDSKRLAATPAAKDAPPRKLLDIATRHPRFNGDFCGWLSSDELLLALADKEYPRGKLVRHNLNTGEQSPLLPLSKIFSRADGGCLPQISPDGQWALWWDMKIHDVSIYGARLDGSGSFRLPKAKAQWDNLYLFWLADSRHFVELALTVTPSGQKFTHALTRTVDQPEVAKSEPIPASSPLQDACCFAGTDIAVAAGDRFIALPWSMQGFGSVGPTLTIGEVGLGPNAKPDRTSTAAVPANTTMRCGVAVSPRSDQIAWLVAKEKSGGGSIVSIWVSQLDGSEWREVGIQDAPEPDTGFGEHLAKFRSDAVGGLQWLPDGRTLSFFCKGDFYTVPVAGSAKAAKAEVRAVYLVGTQGGVLQQDDLGKHPEVRVVHSLADFKRLAETKTALWIDANALPLVASDEEQAWIIQWARKVRPFVLVGFNEPLYSFRDKLDCFGIGGPGPIDWTKYELEPGFSVIMQTEKKIGIETQVAGFMRGYKGKPTTAAILDVTNHLLDGTPVPGESK